MSEEGIIMPFGIYHYIDPYTKTCLAYLSYPSKINENGKHKYYCPGIVNNAQRWGLASVFYAVRPTLRPIPTGLRLFCAARSQSFPYDTMWVSPVYDPYLLEENCVYFLAYNQPVPGTEPLYLHVQGTITRGFEKNEYSHTFPSFDKTPPFADELAWSKPNFGVLYVMTENTVGKNLGDIEFTCVNGRCLPSRGLPQDLYNNTAKKGKDTTFMQCVVGCTELVYQSSNKEDEAESILDSVADESRPTSKLAPVFQKVSPMMVAVIVCGSALAVVMVIFVVVYINKNKNENSGNNWRSRYKKK